NSLGYWGSLRRCVPWCSHLRSSPTPPEGALMRKVVLIVVDGLTPGLFEHAVETRRAPTLTYLAEHGSYRRAVSTFPSLTPVCLSSIATGAHPDVHEIPHLVWWNRERRRLVEYGSSFRAIRAAGLSRSILNTIWDLNARHLSP